MQQLIIFGTGKVADVVFQHIAHSQAYTVAAFTVDRDFFEEGTAFHDRPVIPFEHVARQFPPERYRMLVAIGYHGLNAARREKYEQAKSAGYALASYISPRAGVGNWIQMGDNCIILDHATIEPGVRLGNNVVVWSSALIGHHSTIADHCWIAGNATLGGSAVLGARSFVGLGAIIGHEVEIGEQSLLGAGTLITKCTDPKSVFIQNNTDLFRLDSERYLKISKLR